MDRHSQQNLRTIGPSGHSLDKVKESAAEAFNMTTGIALQSELKIRLQLLADHALAVLPISSLSLLLEAGLTKEEIASLVFTNQNPPVASESSLSPEATARLKLVAGLLAHGLRVYGSDTALEWLHQPIRRFDQKSPLDFVTATQDFDKVDEYLIQVSEGYVF